MNGNAQALGLVEVDFGRFRSWLTPQCARAWRALSLACFAATGWWLTPVSAADVFRTYAMQVDLFNRRYEPVSLRTYLVTLPKHRKRWNGGYYRLRKYPATGRYLSMAAAPVGTNPNTPGSNHGWGIAIDIGWWDRNNNKVLGITELGLGYAWMQMNIGSFGFDNTEVASEKWHHRHNSQVTQRILDIEAYLGLPPIQ